MINVTPTALAWASFVLPDVNVTGTVPLTILTGLDGVDLLAQFLVLAGLFDGPNLVTSSSNASRQTIGENGSRRVDGAGDAAALLGVRPLISRRRRARSEHGDGALRLRGLAGQSPKLELGRRGSLRQVADAIVCLPQERNRHDPVGGLAIVDTDSTAKTKRRAEAQAATWRKCDTCLARSSVAIDHEPALRGGCIPQTALGLCHRVRDALMARLLDVQHMHRTHDVG